VFVLCRTSDVYKDKIKEKSGYIKRTHAKYQIYWFYSEKLGRFEVKEVIIYHTNQKINVQTIGMKNIMLS